MNLKYFSVEELLQKHKEIIRLNPNDYNTFADYFLAKTKLETLLDEWAEFEFLKACYERGFKTYSDIEKYIVNMDFNFDSGTQTIAGIIKENPGMKITINIKFNFLVTICKFSVMLKQYELYHSGIIYIKDYNRNIQIIDKLIINN